MLYEVITKKKAVKKKTVPAKVKKSTVPSTEFCLYAPDAKEVYLAGDFNDSYNFV